jgi:riboflavin synthase
MFTGIIEETGIIKYFNNGELAVYCNKILDDVKIGDSVAVNGVCLTVTKIENKYLCFHVSPTTASHTRFKVGDLRTNEIVNLERALTLNTRLGGHIVTGHIDGKAKIISVKKDVEDCYYEFLYPKTLKQFIALRGSVALDGISLTISDVMSSSFVVTVIPHTVQETNLKMKNTGDFVHIEVDMLSRYLYNILINGGFDEKYRTAFERLCRW